MAEKQGIKATGSLVAGLRAMLGGPDTALHAHFAGKDGQEQARSMVAVSPIMTDAIRARHTHKVQFVKDWDGQIVVVACGLEPLSEYLPHPKRLFLLDLPPMLKRHQQALVSWHQSKGTATTFPHFVSCVLTTTSVLDALRAYPQFDMLKPVRMIMEGLCIYFEEDKLRKLIQGIEPLIGRGDGKGGAWMDIVSETGLKVQMQLRRRSYDPNSEDNWCDMVESKGEYMVFSHDDPVALARNRGDSTT